METASNRNSNNQVNNQQSQLCLILTALCIDKMAKNISDIRLFEALGNDVQR